jgi:hypothetical protein
VAVKFDQIWIENRLRYRKTTKGSRLRLDPVSGYLEPMGRRGFDADKKTQFIDRFTVCKHQESICKSLGISIQAMYDAVAIDPRFREEFIRCEAIPGRSMNLAAVSVDKKISEQVRVVTDLMGSVNKYKK